MRDLVDLSDPTPAGLAYLNLVLASAIPVTWLLTRVLHGLRPRWLSSVAPRLRWAYFAVCLGLSVVALAASIGVSLLLPDQVSGVTGDLNAFTSTTRDFLLAIVLLTPLQAAGEEYAFRGYLLQAFGGFAWRLGERTSAAFAVVASSTLFAFAHGIGQDVPIFFDRLAFGLVAGTLVFVTGGLEAGIAMHVLNNFVAYGLALAFSDMASALEPTHGSWWSIPVTLTQSLVYLVLATLAARWLRLHRTTESDVLVAPRRAV
jgi:membrane protease YdiL (CAAX protease family)